MGIVGPACKVDAVAVKGSLLKITNPAGGGAGSARAASESQLFSPDFSLQDLGIGGLDKQVGEPQRAVCGLRTFVPVKQVNRAPAGR